MKGNIKIIFYIGIIFLSSFLVLGLFLETYSQGLLTSEKNIISVGGMIHQNPKQVTLDVLENMLGDAQTDNVHINSLGFRGDEFTKIKPENTFRIFLLGGSQMFGTGATSDDTTIPGYLANYLEKENHSFTIEVINSGLKGVDSHKELLLLQNMLLDFSPDLVIIYDGLNDLRAGHSFTQVLDNWNSMCALGQNNNFDVIITLQPIAGFGKKSLTLEELVYLQNGKDYQNTPLIDSLNQYERYADNLKRLKNCTDGLDLRFIFDNELDSIYIDEAHVSDTGNSLMAQSLIPHILSNIPIELISNQHVNDKIETSDSRIFSELEYVLGTLYSNFEKNLIRTPFVLSENNSLQNATQSKEIIIKTQSQVYGDDEIEIMIEIIPSQLEFSYDKIIKITTMDKSTDSIIHNVTYLMTIIKNEKSLFTNYFFAEDELLIQVNHNDDENITISGERMYELDALIMNSDNPITISGIFFDLNSTYEFDISLRTIHNPDNFIFLNGFHAEITP